jgi:hypothetical protein
MARSFDIGRCLASGDIEYFLRRLDAVEYDGITGFHHST